MHTSVACEATYPLHPHTGALRAAILGPRGKVPHSASLAHPKAGRGASRPVAYLVHLAEFLLQVLLGHASEARVDHLNNLSESSRGEN